MATLIALTVGKELAEVDLARIVALGGLDGTSGYGFILQIRRAHFKLNAPMIETIEERMARLAEAARRLPNFGRVRPKCRVQSVECRVVAKGNAPKVKRGKVWHAKLSGAKGADERAALARSPVKEEERVAGSSNVVGPDVVATGNAPRVIETGAGVVGAWLSEVADCQNVRMLARLLRGFDLNDASRSAVGAWVSNTEFKGMGIDRPNSRASQINIGSRVGGEVESNVAHDFVAARGLRIVAGNVEGLGWARRVEYRSSAGDETQRNLFTTD